MEHEQLPQNTHPDSMVRYTLPAGKRELIFGVILLAICLLLINCVIVAGFHLGFSIAAVLCILCSSGYLLSGGCKPTGYSAVLLILSIVICACFARTDDVFTKFILLCFLFVSTNLGLSIMAGKNSFSPAGVRSLSDSFSTFFGFGVGQLPASCRGISNTLRSSGTVGQKSSSILLGIGIAVPILLVLVPLLVQADAAFEGMLSYLPEVSVGEIIATVIFGLCFAFLLYTRNTALQHGDKIFSAPRTGKGLSSLTINTVLITVCLVYSAYLVSQLAYFTGGFAGILPEDYTLAQYARRGFFEMAWLCAINLSVMIFSLSLCEKKVAAPIFTRCLCLFIGIVTLFLVSTASAKMLLYIDSYGLTRLRVLTQVIMIFFGIVTLLICIWLFVSKLPYMKAILIAALILGAAIGWADVDTQVAKYNVEQYLEGIFSSVDVSYLKSLGNGAVPYLEKLVQESPDPDIVKAAQKSLETRWIARGKDFRDWNYVNQVAENILLPYSEAADSY